MPRDTKTQEYCDAVRRAMRDYEELNRLISGVENADAHIIDALQDAIEYWNSSPPFLDPVTFNNFPLPRWLVRRSVAYVLNSIIPLQMRNQVSVSDGQGATVNLSDKAPAYQSQVRLIMQESDNQMRQFKISKNIEGGWDTGTGSEMGLMGGGRLI